MFWRNIFSKSLSKWWQMSKQDLNMASEGLKICQCSCSDPVALFSRGISPIWTVTFKYSNIILSWRGITLCAAVITIVSWICTLQGLVHTSVHCTGNFTLDCTLHCTLNCSVSSVLQCIMHWKLSCTLAFTLYYSLHCTLYLNMCKILNPDMWTCGSSHLAITFIGNIGK